MNSEKFRVPAFTFRFFLLLAMTGVLTAVALQVSGAPFWTRYLAGVVGAPFIFHAVRSVERVAPTSGPLTSRGREA
jgi:uncharacterized membrane protein YdcZ (DUF606 family)